jgi:signal peptidase I
MSSGARIFGAALRVCIGAGVTVLVLQTFLVLGVIVPLRVDGNSMAPTLSDGERILVDRTAYWFRSPARWNLVVLRCPHDPLVFCVKRVAGLPGEPLQIRGGRVLIDGVAAAGAPEVYFEQRRGSGGDASKYELGENEYFVLGDNSRASIDSRVWDRSAVRENTILGRVYRWPFTRSR